MDIKNVAVIGAGTMGNGIALVDVNDECLKRGVGAISNSLDRLIKKEKITANQKDQILGRINTTTDTGRVSGCQLIVEAVFEDADIKKQLWKELSRSEERV